MALVSIKVPEATSRFFTEVSDNAPGEKTDSRYYHVSVVYLGDNVSLDILGKALGAIYDVTSKTRPYTLRSNVLTHFKGVEKVPCICLIKSPELHQFQKDLCKAFDKHNIPYSKKFPEYRPHVTLSYAKDAIDIVEFPEISWICGEVTLWGGDHGDQKLFVTFPLASGMAKEAYFRGLVRVANQKLRKLKLFSKVLVAMSQRLGMCQSCGQSLDITTGPQACVCVNGIYARLSASIPSKPSRVVKASFTTPPQMTHQQEVASLENLWSNPQVPIETQEEVLSAMWPTAPSLDEGLTIDFMPEEVDVSERARPSASVVQASRFRVDNPPPRIPFSIGEFIPESVEVVRNAVGVNASISEIRQRAREQVTQPRPLPTVSREPQMQAPRTSFTPAEPESIFDALLKLVCCRV